MSFARNDFAEHIINIIHKIMNIWKYYISFLVDKQ